MERLERQQKRVLSCCSAAQSALRLRRPGTPPSTSASALKQVTGLNVQSHRVLAKTRATKQICSYHYYVQIRRDTAGKAGGIAQRLDV